MKKTSIILLVLGVAITAVQGPIIGMAILFISGPYLIALAGLFYLQHQINQLKK